MPQKGAGSHMNSPNSTFLNSPAFPLPSADTDSLELGYLSRLFDNMSECYKLFWFQAIVDQLTAGNLRPSFDDLINNMIADAWYMVSEYKLNLGPSDTLEALVHYTYQLSGLRSAEKKETVLKYLKNCTDKELLKRKKTLSLYVPYRLQSPFMPEFKGEKAWSASGKELGERINRHQHLIYYFLYFSGLQTQIEISPEWEQYLVKNQEIIRGWIRFHMISYLQKRNPNVPGISNKLNPPAERNLTKAKKFWKKVIELHPTADIYTGGVLSANDLSIDHFIPWSYVTHDEFWNLNPTTRSVNSRKSNRLPDWDAYFQKLCETEYRSYEMVWQYEALHTEYEKCLKDYINSDEVRFRLYRKGIVKTEFFGRLEEIISPVYQSARNQGFENWRYE